MIPDTSVEMNPLPVRKKSKKEGKKSSSKTTSHLP
jgi:hypothetical protein